MLFRRNYGFSILDYFYVFCSNLAQIDKRVIVKLLIMAGLEELKKKLAPLFDAEKGFSSGSSMDPSDSYLVIFFLLM